jgi:hypothetical protein
VRQEVDVKDPLAVSVTDEKGRPLFPAGTVGESRTAGRPITRDAAGALTFDDHVVGDARGHFVSVAYANHRPSLASPSFPRDDVVFAYPLLTGRRGTESARVWLTTPLSNVTRVREVRAPEGTGAAFVFGIILAAAGAGVAIDGATHSGLSAGERAAEMGLGAAGLAAPGIALVAIDLYGFLAPRSDKLLFPP